MQRAHGGGALAAVDRLVWEVVAASGDLAQGRRSGLARLLREGAAAALTGVAWACREARRERAVAHLEGVVRELRRLATWLDLAERFGDLPADRTVAALEAQALAQAEVEALAAAWRGEPAAAAAGEDDQDTRPLTPVAASSRLA
jgi:hypothetical protein